ncbi:MAG: prephenate dehydrogenase/arogenate dehydrogenase family protein [Candidatus Methanomethyliaceae archaeon]|nr:prephenate dehydrogenase/arogenate dehydrogenase family protein [Candidatus Methanomethyliaceae archaeon]MDW7970561.1 prephenate dehydrogenase/arogenate dehydrogenase family protein [Nitrososphaerota archaeon]
MGRCMAYLLKGVSEVMINSRDFRQAKKVARKIGVKACSFEDLSNSDIIIATVPSEILLEVAKKAFQIMKEGSLFVDVSSVKCGIIEEIANLLPPKLEYISLHPLFASPRVKIKNVIMIPINAKNWNERLEELLIKAGMRVGKCSAEEHDKIMAAYQVAHHFTYLSLKETLKKMNFENMQEIFITHSLRKTLAVLRLIERNIKTVEEIQRMNKFASIARRIFIQEAKRLDESYSSWRQIK